MNFLGSMTMDSKMSFSLSSKYGCLWFSLDRCRRWCWGSDCWKSRRRFRRSSLKRMLRMCIFLRDSSCLSANCMVVKSLNSSRELSTWINSLEYNAMEIYFYVCWLTEALHKYCCWHLLFHSGGKYTPKSLIVPQNNKIIAGKHLGVLS